MTPSWPAQPTPRYVKPTPGARCSGVRVGPGSIAGGCQEPAFVQHTLWGVWLLSCEAHFVAGGGDANVARAALAALEATAP
jgi:hypothetical protein